MNENNKKLSLLSQLDNIMDNNYVNNSIEEYHFSNIHTIVLNNVQHQVSNYDIHIILYLDELIVETYKNNKLYSSYSLPYNFIDNFHLIGGDL